MTTSSGKSRSVLEQLDRPVAQRPRVRPSVAAAAAPKSSMTTRRPTLRSTSSRSRVRMRGARGGGARRPRTRAPAAPGTSLSCSRCSMRFGRSRRSRVVVEEVDRHGDRAVGERAAPRTRRGAPLRSSTDQPMRTSSELSSSSTRNSPGARRPRLGMVPAQQRLDLDGHAGRRGRPPVGRAGSAHRSRARVAAPTRRRRRLDAVHGSTLRPGCPSRYQRIGCDRRVRLSRAPRAGSGRAAAPGRGRRGGAPPWPAAAGRARAPRRAGRRTPAAR